MKIKYPLLVAFAALFTFPVVSQVRIGEAAPAEKGAILDLSSTTYVGGLKLPNVNITDLGKIPGGFTEVSVQNQDVNTNLTGILVYNINTTTGVGAYVWDGDNWIKFGSTDVGLPGVPGDWVDINGSGGNGTATDNYTNICPATTVVVTAKDGYVFLSASNGSISGNTATFSAVGNGWVSVMKNGKTGLIYVTVQSCTPFVCGSNGIAANLVVGANIYQIHQYATGTNGEYQCWMVDNLKEGAYNSNSNVPGATGRTDINGYGGNGTIGSGGGPYPLGERGYYYSWYQAQTMCPDGWSLPTEAQFDKLFGKNISGTNAIGEDIPVISDGNSNTDNGRWWHGSGSGGTAFAGQYAANGTTWQAWNNIGYWYASGTSGRFYSGDQAGLLGVNATGTNRGLSVRCVKNN